MRLVMFFLLATTMTLWTTSRHEASHALAAWSEGADIQKIQLLPEISDELGFTFGYVQSSGEVSWLTDAAPFMVDVLLMISAGFLLSKLKPQGRWYFIIMLFGIVSPLIDIAYGYLQGQWRAGTDVADLLRQGPDLLVHTMFLASIGLGVYLLRRARRRKSGDLESDDA